MIPSWLQADLWELFQRDQRLRVVLWFDEKEEFAPFLAQGGFSPPDAGFRLLQYDREQGHGQLWLKAQMVWETRHLPEEERRELRTVLYLPFGPEALDAQNGHEEPLAYLLEYKFSGRMWLVDGKKPTLFTFLRKHSVSLPEFQREQRALWEGGKESLLAKLIARFLDRDAAFWKQPLTPTRAVELLLGPLDELLLPFLADPANEAGRLQRTGLLQEFRDCIAHEFGFTHPLENPEEWAREFTIRLAMAECYEAFGAPGDFPFPAMVPPQAHRNRWVSFLRRWMSHQEFALAYRRLMAGLEPAFDLYGWSSGKTGRPQSMLHLALARWRGRFEEFTAASGSRSQVSEWLDAHAGEIKEEVAGYWAALPDGVPGWALLRDLEALHRVCRDGLTEASGLTEARKFVDAYTARWLDADRLYRRLFVAVRGQHGMESILTAAKLVYGHFLQTVNGQFFTSLEKEGAWESQKPRGVQQHASELWSGDQQVAVIVSDALRADLAQEIQSIRDAEVEIDHWIASTPTITPVGMTAMLPLSKPPAIVLSAGKTEILDDQFGDLSVKANRVKLLAERAGASTLSLSELLQAPANPHPEARRLVVFTKEIDDIGEATGIEVCKHLGAMVEDIRSAIRKLHAWGIPTVHVATDHGFLLIPQGGPQASLPAGACIKKSPRYAILAEGAVVDAFVRPVRLDSRHRVAYPPGVATFTVAPEYMHGGLSLQEIVIPHIVSRATSRAQKVGVRVALKSMEISVLAVKVTLLPEPPPGHTLLDPDPQPRDVLVSLTRGDEQVCLAPKQATLTPGQRNGGVDVIVVLDEDSDPRLGSGDVLTLHVRDADTGEELAHGFQLKVTRDF